MEYLVLKNRKNFKKHQKLISFSALARKFHPHTHWGRHNAKTDMKKFQDPDLKSAEQIVKKRVRKEKNLSREKNARMRNQQKRKNSAKKRMSKGKK